MKEGLFFLVEFFPKTPAPKEQSYINIKYVIVIVIHISKVS